MSMVKYSESTPLHFAVQEHQTRAVEDLLRANADVNSRDQRGITPLMVAARWGFADIINLLIQAGANINAKDRANPVDYGRRTALYHACMTGRVGMVKLLLEHGAEPDCLAQHGYTPLSTVIRIAGNREIVFLLLEHGASPSGPDGCWEPPITAAASNNDVHLVKDLLDRGADPNRMGQSGDLALCSTVSEECARVLLQLGARIDLRDGHGQTPLLQNVTIGSPKLIRTYINAGADVDAKDKYGYTPLMRLAELPRIEVADMLIQAGADINLIPVKNCTALDWIVNFDSIQYRAERQALVEFLRSRGATTGDELRERLRSSSRRN